MPRRVIQRAFPSWLEANRSRFANDIKLGRRTDTVQLITFACVNRAIDGYLSTYEICMVVTHEGESWDILLDLDAEPKRVPGGYVRDLRAPESRPVFPNRPALWADHLFEHMLEWVNGSLAGAKWLALWQPGLRHVGQTIAGRSAVEGASRRRLTLRYSAWAGGGARPEKWEAPPVLLPCRAT